MSNEQKQNKLEGIVISAPTASVVSSDKVTFRMLVRIQQVEYTNEQYEWIKNNFKEIEVHFAYVLPIFMGDNIRAIGGSLLGRDHYLFPTILERLDEAGAVKAKYFNKAIRGHCQVLPI